jgi:hypothetical protein
LGINAIQFVGIDHGVWHISDLELASDLPCDCALANAGNSTYHEDVTRRRGYDSTRLAKYRSGELPTSLDVG